MFRKKQNHQCALCGFKCNYKHQLVNHIRQHTQEKSFVCDLCQRGYSTKAYLNTHIWYVHKKNHLSLEKKYKCSSCSFATYQQSRLNAHTRVHTERKFPCQHPDCEYAAKSSFELQLHNNYRHNNKRKFLCQEEKCDFRGKTMACMTQHSITHSDYRPFVCDFDGCSHRAKRPAQLKKHKLTVHGGGYKPFACSICNYRTALKYSLTRHQLTHTKDKSVKCDISGCSYSCYSKTALKSHFLHNHTERTFKCDFKGCFYDGDSRHFLKEHQKNAHYKCLCCGYQAENQRALRVHMDCNHPLIPCPTKYCNFQARNLASLQRHQRHHEANLACSIDGCSYVGASISGLKHHIKFHDPTGRPFHCPLCPKHFPTNPRLSDHLRVHTGEKPFQCPACDYGSCAKLNLMRHVQVIHSAVFTEFVLDDEAHCKHCGVNFGNAMGLAIHTMRLKTASVALTRLEIKTGGAEIHYLS